MAWKDWIEMVVAGAAVMLLFGAWDALKDQLGEIASRLDDILLELRDRPQ